MLSLFSRSLLFSSFVISAIAGPYQYWRPRQKRSCATPDPDDHLRAQHDYLQYHEPLENELYNSTMIKDFLERNYPEARSVKLTDLINPYTIDKRQAGFEPIYTIDTYFHIVQDTDNSVPGASGYVTEQMISEQLVYLKNAYRGVGIDFNLLDITRTVNDSWARNDDELAMKSALRRGSYSTLNVYYQTQLQSHGERGIMPGELVLGFCFPPATNVRTTTPPSEYVLDGCNILSGTMPGGTQEDYNLGGTSAHEIGHWNGLLHPFQDETCDPDNFGDYVADTPQEMFQTIGCPIEKDTCPDSGVPADSYNGASTLPNPYGPAGFSGPDPIHNIMDYSQDSCYEGFTPGQGARMVNLWVIYRMGL